MPDIDVRPSSDAIGKFLSIFRKLETFEARERYARGHGALDRRDLCRPEVTLVASWLNNLAKPDIHG